MKGDGSLPIHMSQRVHRLIVLGGTIAFIATFRWLYLRYLVPEWSYFGFTYESSPWEYHLLAWGFSLAPLAWMPLALSRTSQLAYWVLYFTVFIPSMFVPLYVQLSSLPEIGALMLTMFVGFALIGFTYALPLVPLPRFRVSSGLFWTAVSGIVLILVAWSIAVFRHSYSLVAFQDVYGLRFAADDVMEKSLVHYALMWLSGAIDPLLMAVGLYYKRPWLLLAGILGQTLVYGSIGTKGSISSILFISVLYLVLKRKRALFAETLSWGFVSLLATLGLIYTQLKATLGPLLSSALFLVLMRTFSLQGLLTAWYYDFFHRNPLTYSSTVTGISWFVKYPYANPLGIEVGQFYSGDATHDAIAHFWASDGLAAFGLPGILAISIVCGLVFWALDSATAKHDARFAALATSYAAYNLCNIPLFTSLLSGGLGLLTLLLYLMPVVVRDRQPVPVASVSPSFV